jgi:hypothetical protein
MPEVDVKMLLDVTMFDNICSLHQSLDCPNARPLMGAQEFEIVQVDAGCIIRNQRPCVRGLRSCGRVQKRR